MNAASGSISVPALLAGQLPAAEVLTPDPVAGVDFSAALAAAVAPLLAGVPIEQLDVEDRLPDGMQSAAALAWMAGMLGAELPRRDAPVADAEGDAADITGVVATSLQLPTRTFAATAVDTKVVASDASAPLALLKAFGDASTRSAGVELAAQSHEAPMIGAEISQPESISVVTRVLAEFADQVATPTAAAPEIEPRLLTVASMQGQARDALVVGESSNAGVPGASGAIRTPVGAPRWADEVGSRLVLMATRGQQEGSLSLTPEHLGPLEVRISISQDTTSVWFGAQHADTRAALSDALPRLRELLAASGLALGHAGVSQEMPRQAAREAEQAATQINAGAAPADALAAAPDLRRVRSALLDAWA